MNKFANVLFAAVGILSFAATIGLLTARSARSTTGGPVAVQDVNFHAHQPVQFLAQPDTYGTNALDAETDIPVPVGKRLTIEYISAEVGSGTGDATILTTVAGKTVAYYLIERSSDHSHKYFPTTIYADPGTNVQVLVHRNASTDPRVYADVEISGYYENVP